MAEKIDGCGDLWLHYDVMDGEFVENITFGSAVLRSLKPHTRSFIDVHLMVSHPERQIPLFAEAGADHITFHVESKCDPHKIIALIHSYGISAGVAIKPATPVSVLETYMGEAEMALLMTVEPGYGGQGFIMSSLDKIKEIRRKKPTIDVQVDGGINDRTAPLVKEAGANILVAGTYLLHAPDMGEAVKTLL